jgi:hypothetical protein
MLKMRKLDADILAQVLEAIERGETTREEIFIQYPDLRDELTGLFETISLCQNYPSSEVRTNFRIAARSRILSNMKSHDPVTFGAFLRRIWKNTSLVIERRPVMTLVLIVTLVMSLIGGGTVYASQGSLPGDVLYSVKIALEDTLLGLSSETSAPDLSSQYAGERVEEVKGLIERQRFEYIPSAMRRYQDQAIGADPEHVSVHIEILTGLLEVVPEQAKPAIEDAIAASSKFLDKLPQGLPEKGRPSELPGEPPVELPPLPVEPPVLPPPDKPGDVPPVTIPVVPPVEPPSVPPAPPLEPPTGVPTEPPVVDPPPVPPVQPPNRP